MIRSLLALCCIGASLLLAGCNKAPEPQRTSETQLTSVRFLTDWYPQPEHGGFYNALVRGYYKDAGLDVTIEPGGPNIYPTQRVPVGAGEFGMASSDTVLTANAEGQNLVAIGATMQWDPQAIMLHPEDPANSFADLEGRTIAAVPGSVWFRYLVKKFNFQNVKEIPATFTIANFLHDPQYIQQIFVTSEPFFVEQSGGAKPKILLIKDTGYQIYRVFFTTRSYMEKNPEVVRKFVSASVKGWRDYIQDPSAANAEIAKRNPEMNVERMKFSWTALKEGGFVYGSDPSGALTGKFDPQRWAENYQILRNLGVITKDIDPSRGYTLEFTKGL
jgi:NitT/TauT family transport system substrate-binding protein